MKEFIVSSLSFAMLMAGSVLPAQAAPPPQVEERKLTLNAEQLEHFSSRMGAGKIKLSGEAGRTEIQVLARIHYYAEEDIRLNLEARKEVAYLEAGFTGGSYSGQDPYIDLVVLVPAHFSAELNSGRGDIEVSQLDGMVRIENAAGNVFAQSTGGIRVVNGSEGKVSTQDIKGPVQISQRSTN